MKRYLDRCFMLYYFEIPSPFWLRIDEIIRRASEESNPLLASISTSSKLHFRFLRLPLLAVVAWMPARGLDPNLALTQYIHTSWTRGQTFSLPDIQALTQTPDGYLWLGTTKGVFRS